MAQPRADEMKRLVKQGKAMPAPEQDRPGRFPIRNAQDLDNAVRAVGRVQPPTEDARAKVRRFIMRAAKRLSLTHPAFKNWNADGTLKT